MNSRRKSPLFQILLIYYGILQSAHLISLVRAGWIWTATNQMVFPAPPPQGGWAPETIPFLFGMGLVDALAAFLGIAYVGLAFREKTPESSLGLISLTSALTSAFVFVAGTFSAGAWCANPAAYGALVVLFSPLIPLYAVFLREHSRNQ
jgi:hypothetical protein